MSERQEIQDWMRRLQNGDKRYLEKLYEHFTPLLYSVARRITGDANVAEEVTERAWLEAADHVNDYDALQASVGGWLLGLVRGYALERKSKSRMVVGPDDDADPELVRRHEQVEATLAEMEDHERRVLDLAYFEGLDPHAIAERLQQPLESVMSAMRSGLVRLYDSVAEAVQ